MKLFHNPLSSSSRRVKLTTALLELPLELEPINLAGPADRARLRAINPNEKVPVLVDGDFVLWESHAIMQYLADAVPGQTVYPTERQARADVQRWLAWIGAHLGPAIGPIAFERLWKKFIGAGEPDLAVIARHEGLFRPVAAIVDDHLATRTWLVGDHLTLADLSLAATLMYAQPTQLPLEPYRHLRDFLGRVHELPAWRATDPGPIGPPPGR